MSTTSMPPRLLEETRRAFSRDAEIRTRVEELSGQRPGPGDVFVLDQPGDFVVEWAVLACVEDPVPRVFVVPADGGQVLGSADVAVTDGPSAGSLTLRCRWAGWFSEETFASATRTSILAAGVVSRAVERCTGLAKGSFTASTEAREVDDSPDYQDWRDRVLLPARQDLLDRDEAAASRKTLSRLPLARRRRETSPRRHSLLAASVLFALAGGLVSGWVWRQQMSVPSLEGLGPVVNPVIAILDRQDDVRGHGPVLRAPKQASHVIFLLPLRVGNLTSSFRADLIEVSSRESVWTSGVLVPESPGELRVGVPAGWLIPGDYRFVLSDLDDSSRGPVEEYRFSIEEEGH